MASDPHPARRVLPAPADAIRIVPLYVPDSVGQPTAGVQAAAPQLTYRNGPLLTAVEVFTIFWGPAWQHAPQSGMGAKSHQVFAFLLTSHPTDQLAEYSLPG